jgi:hypothetical protein
MKKILAICLLLVFIHNSNAQRKLNWSIGKVNVNTEESILKVTYALMVSIDNKNNNPTLGTSTIRFFYDNNNFENFTIEDIANGYSQSGLKQSEAIFGDMLGFSGEKGTFVQFDILQNSANLLNLSKKPVQVLNFSFDVSDEAQFPICAALVFDNHPNSWGQGKEKDRGYLFNDSGIAGTYLLGDNPLNSYMADDEVSNHDWKSRSSVARVIKSKSDKFGNASKGKCIKNPKKSIDLKEISFANGAVTMYPVPFDGEVFVKIKFDYSTHISIQIVDIQGSLILEKKNLIYNTGEPFKQKLDLSRVDDQIFFVKIITDRNSYSKKIVSNNVSN